jgi:hypothetical protein
MPVLEQAPARRQLVKNKRLPIQPSLRQKIVSRQVIPQVRVSKNSMLSAYELVPDPSREANPQASEPPQSQTMQVGKSFYA